MFGISAALTTPYQRNGSVDFDRLNYHLKTVLSEGCSSVTLFGTTGEGPSVAWDMRRATLEAAMRVQVNPARLVLALHGAAVTDVVMQAKWALKLGVKRFLLPPPCYFSQPGDAGLFAWFASVFSQLAGSGAQIILYHIPQVIGVGLPVSLVAKLKAEFTPLVFGVKDSSGSFANTKELLKLPDLEILIGDERLLAAGVQLGASGAISGIANVFPARIAQVFSSGVDDPQINQLVDTVLKFDVTPAVKSLVAHKTGVPEWRKTTPPLEATPDADYATLVKASEAVAKSAGTILGGSAHETEG